MPHRVALAGAIALAVPAAAAAQQGPPPQVHNRMLSTVTEGGRQVFRLDAKENDGVAWWPETAFTTGIIELDIRGRNVPQASFVGVAFHGVDATTYEGVYFRPFNFRTEDPARRLRAVQYISHPAHPWQVLREKTPGVYEKPVVPPPDPDAWFHARIHITADTVTVFVDRAASPVLEVKRLTDRAGGWVGIWVGNGSPGDFANVTINPDAGAPKAGAAARPGQAVAAATAATPTPATRPATAATPTPAMTPATAAAPATGATAGLSGTYAGQVVPEEGGGAFSARIVLVDRGDAVDVTLGPPDQPLMPASNVRKGRVAFSKQ